MKKTLLKAIPFIMVLTFWVNIVNGQGHETFDNLEHSGSTYIDGTFLGQDGSTWTFVQCRGDIEITGKAITMGRNRDPQSTFYSGVIPNGIGTLSFKYMQAFSTNVNLDVYVNEQLAANVTSNSQQDLVLESGEIDVNIGGDFVIKFINKNNSDGQVVVDDIVWTEYGDGPTQVSTPSFSPQSGTYYEGLSVNITTVTQDADIYYTTNGEEPTESDNLFTAPIEIYDDIVIKARGFKEGLDPSNVATAEYMLRTLLLQKDFEDNDLLSGGWSVYDIKDGANSWHISSFGGIRFAQITEYESNPEYPESYLISPKISINDELENIIFSFENTVSYKTGDALSVKISTDYTGSGNPGDASWNILSAIYDDPEETHGNWTSSGNISLDDYAGEDVYIAFHYLSDSDNHGRWRVNDIMVISNFVPPADDDASLSLFKVGSINVLNLSDINVDTPDDEGAMLEVVDFSTFYGIEVKTHNINATFTVELNGVEINEELLAEQGLNEGDVILVTVLSFDETSTMYYKVTLEQGDDPYSVATLAELRAGTIGQTYTFTGEAVLTFQQSYRKQKFIQDETGGILIDDPLPGVINTEYSIGDGISNIKGVLASYAGMLQIQPVLDPGPATSIGNPIIPLERTLGEINSGDQARLIKVYDVDFQTPGSFAVGTVYEISDPSGPGVFRTNFYDADYIGNSIPMETITLIALVTEHGSVFQLTARTSDDFLAEDPNFINQAEIYDFKVFPNPFNDVINIKLNEDVIEVVVYNNIGQEYNRLKNHGSELIINTTGMSKGIYFLRFIMNDGSIYNKKIIKQ